MLYRWGFEAPAVVGKVEGGGHGSGRLRRQ
jgi:hypothetical protein